MGKVRNWWSLYTDLGKAGFDASNTTTMLFSTTARKNLKIALMPKFKEAGIGGYDVVVDKSKKLHVE